MSMGFPTTNSAKIPNDALFPFPLNSIVAYRWIIPFLASKPKDDRNYWLCVEGYLREWLFKAYDYADRPYNERLFKLIISDIVKHGYY